MIKAVFFDFNGVIIDDESIQMKAYQEILREHEVPLTEEWYFDALGMDDKTFVRYAFERARKPLSPEIHAAILDRKTQLHRTMIEDELPLFPGVVTFLKALSRGYELGLVSMANTVEISYVLNRARIGSLFTVLITADEVNVCKPAPDCYEVGLKRLNESRQQRRLLPLLPSECLAIEDSPPGVKSAGAAGMRTLGVTNTVSEDALRAAGAEVVTANLSDWTPDSVTLLYK
jgi:phosphoglycolate phosphatase/beta-phosphoglucomutase